MELIAGAVVLVCLAGLVSDFSRRWGRPRRYTDVRSVLTYGVGAAMVAALIVINLVD